MGRKKSKILVDNIQVDPSEIGQRAHQKWIDRGCVDGFAEQDWLQAEAELRAEKAAACVVSFEVKPKQKKEKKEEPVVDPIVGEYPNFPTGNGSVVND